ncbi:hypothetical protein KIN20_030342 [Parelaphostrongylus tenuis]|uniref:Uncharacterized protein n=1 Tax=Parelaphostrongylus tenuis TaxID=148309 RepID=A0AAD5WGB2_PARTN|nr:hypothetical protein KIN20_030342 [Parelaphostrongylus tenuis]
MIGFTRSRKMNETPRNNNCKFGKIGFIRSMLRPHWISENCGVAIPSTSNIVFTLVAMISI